MNSTTAQFLEFLKSGIWGTDIDPGAFHGEIDWNRIYCISEEQTVTALAFDGKERLPREMHPDMDMLADWLGQTSNLETQNKILNKDLLTLTAFVSAEGFKYSLLKGKGCASVYPKPSHRQ